MALMLLTLLAALAQDSDVVNERRFGVWGRRTIEGNYVQLNAATLRVTFPYAGDSAALQVRGGAFLSGGLRIRFDYFQPAGGERYEIIQDAAFLKGRFTRLDLPSLPPGLVATLVYDDLASGCDLDQDGKCDVTLVIEHPRL